METSTSRIHKFTVAMLIIEAVMVTVPVIVLGKYFNFPDILRQPAGAAFELFNANGAAVISAYYIFLLSSLVYIPLTYSFKRLYGNDGNKIIFSALSGLGITTSIFQSIGFIRWVFVMPYLTEVYFSQPESKQTVILIYETLNRYAGMSIGEHLGFIAMGSWTIVLGLILTFYTQTKKWVGNIGIAIGVLLVVSVSEHFGGKYAQLFGVINFLANALWTLWLIVVALFFGISKKKD